MKLAFDFWNQVTYGPPLIFLTSWKLKDMLLKPLQVHTAWNIYQEWQVRIMYCITLEFINIVLTEIMCKQGVFKVVKHWRSASIHLVCSKISVSAEWSLLSHKFGLYLMPWHQYMTNLLTQMIQMTYNHECIMKHVKQSCGSHK